MAITLYFRLSFDMDSDISIDTISLALADICQNLKLEVIPKVFQQEFFLKAVQGFGGFLQVSFGQICFDILLLNMQAPCGAGKSLLYQLLPFILKKYR